MRDVTVTQLVYDNEGNLTILDTEGRVWMGYQTTGSTGWKWVWNRVTLPEVDS